LQPGAAYARVARVKEVGSMSRRRYSALQITANSWDEALSLARYLGSRFVFRGQRNATWSLQTRLERECDSVRLAPSSRKSTEDQILEYFGRRIHLYVNALHMDALSLLSLLQHHGGPTRLLDFTRSFYVAAFFALEDAREADQCAAVFACDGIALAIEADVALGTPFAGYLGQDSRPKKVEYVNRVLSERGGISAAQYYPENMIFEDRARKPAVLVVDPDWVHERIDVQQGTFLFPTKLDVSFEANLAYVFGWGEKICFCKASSESWNQINKEAPVALLKLELPYRVRASALSELQRMNVTAQTLFPGLDGFARSQSKHVYTTPFFGNGSFGDGRA
jgi:hypothetical protein